MTCVCSESHPRGMTCFLWLTIPDEERERLLRWSAELWWHRRGRFLDDNQLLADIGVLIEEKK